MNYLILPFYLRNERGKAVSIVKINLKRTKAENYIVFYYAYTLLFVFCDIR